MSAAFPSCKNVSAPRYLRQAPTPSRQLPLTWRFTKRVCLCVSVGAGSCVCALLPVRVYRFACILVCVCTHTCFCVDMKAPEWYVRAPLCLCAQSRPPPNHSLHCPLCWLVAATQEWTLAQWICSVLKTPPWAETPPARLK